MHSPKPHQNPPMIQRVALYLLAIAGLAVNLLLLVRGLSDEGSSLAGCGPGSGCDTVLGSQWSKVLGMPVTVPGFLVYAVLLLALTRAGRPLLAPLLGIILSAAAWFIIVQAVLIDAFCPWCMAAHAIGITLAALGLPVAVRASGSWPRTLTIAAIAGAGSLFILIILQVFGPKPATHQLSDVPPAAPAGEPTRPGESSETPLVQDAHSAGDGRLAVFFDGRKGYRVEELPHLGNADAEHVIVEYFDYACAACRTMGGYLESLVAVYPQDICVILLPVPLDRECNPSMPPLEPGHPGACRLARAALAIWRQSRENFTAFHKAVLADPDPDTTEMLAQALLPDPATAIQDPWITAIIDANVADWHLISTENARLPKLLINNRRVLHGFPQTEAEFIHLIATQLGLTP